MKRKPKNSRKTFIGFLKKASRTTWLGLALRVFIAGTIVLSIALALVSIAVFVIEVLDRAVA